MRYDAFKVRGFGYIQQHWVVFGLATDFDQPNGAMSISGGRGEHPQEIGLADVVGAGAGNEDPTGAKHLERAEVEFLVSPDGRV